MGLDIGYETIRSDELVFGSLVDRYEVSEFNGLYLLFA